MKYKKFDNKSLGKHTVKFTVKTGKGKKLELKQEFKVIDTTCPKVTCSRASFTIFVDSRSNKDLNNTKNLKAVENLVRPCVSCNEDDCDIVINTVNVGELAIDKFPIIITATDKSGNVGSCQVMLEVKLKNKAMNKSGALSKKEKESLKQRAREMEKKKNKLEEETTKKQKQKKKKKKEDVEKPEEEATLPDVVETE